MYCMTQGGGSQTQQYLNRLLIALESYYHPSNIGIHTVRKIVSYNVFIHNVVSTIVTFVNILVLIVYR